MDSNEEIIICKECKGEGIVYRSECTSYHNGDYDNWTEKCPDCKGSGRKLIKTIIQIQDTPYSTPKPDGSRKKMLEKQWKARS